MRLNLIFREPKKGKKPSAIRVTFQIDEAIAYVEDSEEFKDRLWNVLDKHLADWEGQMQARGKEY